MVFLLVKKMLRRETGVNITSGVSSKPLGMSVNVKFVCVVANIDLALAQFYEIERRNDFNE